MAEARPIAGGRADPTPAQRPTVREVAPAENGGSWLLVRRSRHPASSNEPTTSTSTMASHGEGCSIERNPSMINTFPPDRATNQVFHMADLDYGKIQIHPDNHDDFHGAWPTGHRAPSHQGQGAT